MEFNNTHYAGISAGHSINPCGPISDSDMG